MEKEGFIAIRAFCSSHQLEISFVEVLNEYGLIQTKYFGEEPFIADEELPKLEQMAHLYYLDINPEGIQTITHLLKQMEIMQQEITHLKNKIGRFE